MELLDAVRNKLPPYPNWRWVSWHILHGKQMLEAGQDIHVFCQWALDRWQDRDELYLELQLETLLAWATRGHSGVDAAQRLYNDGATRACIERSLLCGLTHKECAAAATRVGGVEVDPMHITIYEETFFDRKHIARSQMGHYYTIRGQADLWTSYQCPLPYKMQREWALAQSGEVPSVDVSVAINMMVMRSMSAVEQLASADPTSRYAREWAKVALRAMLAGNDLGVYKSGNGKLPDHLVAEVNDDYAQMDGSKPDGEVVFLKQREYRRYATPEGEGEDQ